jgi:sulfur carrier protein
MPDLTVNGERRAVADGTTMAALLAELGVAKTGTAVALNGKVVRGALASAEPLRDGDVVEIIRAVAGG